MRQAAGVILIILGIVGLTGLATTLSTSNIYVELLSYLHLILWRIASAALLAVGGVFASGGGIGERIWLPPCLHFFSLEFLPQLIMLGGLGLIWGRRDGFQ